MAVATTYQGQSPGAQGQALQSQLAQLMQGALGPQAQLNNWLSSAGPTTLQGVIDQGYGNAQGLSSSVNALYQQQQSNVPNTVAAFLNAQGGAGANLLANMARTLTSGSGNVAAAGSNPDMNNALGSQAQMQYAQLLLPLLQQQYGNQQSMYTADQNQFMAPITNQANLNQAAIIAARNAAYQASLRPFEQAVSTEAGMYGTPDTQQSGGSSGYSTQSMNPMSPLKSGSSGGSGGGGATVASYNPEGTVPNNPVTGYDQYGNPVNSYGQVLDPYTASATSTGNYSTPSYQYQSQAGSLNPNWGASFDFP